MFNIFARNKSNLYADLKPGDRIYKIIETYIYPDLERCGFTMSKSKLSITRQVGDFKQEISFQKSKWNNGNKVVAFDPHFTVTIKNYKNWYKKKYSAEPLNDCVLGARANYIPNWNKAYYQNGWYDFARDDNKNIIEVLKSNINQNGLFYLNSLSERQSAILFILKSGSFYYKAPMLFDFAIQLNNKDLAARILKWFDEYILLRQSDFRKDTLEEMDIRTKILNNWTQT